MHPLTGGTGVFIGEPFTVDLKSYGYLQREYTAAGIATSYRAEGALKSNGRWSFAADGGASYRTRVLVRYPADPARFSGTVVVEWLNVSGGVDADPEWASINRDVLRSGDAWVGVSTQLIGVMGGPVLVAVPGPGAAVAGKGLRAIDPDRYGPLHLPGDGFSFDIFTQVARALRKGSGLSGLHPRHIIAAGESQSAFALVTYYDGVQPLTHAFDGFYVHSRGAAGLPLAAPGQPAGIQDAVLGTPVTFRSDQVAPVIDVQSEADLTGVLNSYGAQQPDTRRFRLWEVTGTAHADVHLIGPEGKAINCGVPINDGPMYLVATAGFHDLVRWIEGGAPPPHAPRIEVDPGPPARILRAPDGIALGGIRTPPVEVPVATLSGAPGPSNSLICLLLGSTTPFSAAQLTQLYSSRSVYMRRYVAATDATIKSGWALPQDRAALLAFADESVIPG